MKRLLAGALVAMSLAACSDATGPEASPASPGAKSPIVQPDVRADHYIVVYRENVGRTPATASRMITSGRVTVERTYTAALNGFAAKLDSGQVAALRADPDVAIVEPDIIVHAQGRESSPDWGLDRLDQRSLPLSNSYTYASTGSGVNAYIIDTGIRYSHTDLGGRAHFAFDAFGGNGADCMGHGTHVSGTVGGIKYGVAKAVTLWSVRVLQCDGSAPLSDIIAGIDWVTAHHRSPAVANMSLGASMHRSSTRPSPSRSGRASHTWSLRGTTPRMHAASIRRTCLRPSTSRHPTTRIIVGHTRTTARACRCLRPA